ncbi:MAG: hypothetical protein ABIZ95_02035 [Pyrinomonadaceae bacterium]
MTYQISWAPPAELAYIKLRDDAQLRVDAGDEHHPAVMIFHEVEAALDGRLATDAYDPRLALAGSLNCLFKLPLTGLSITYMVAPAPRYPEVVILTITPKRMDVWRQLQTGIECGAFDAMLKTFSIPNPIEGVELAPGMVH